ncbi:MAG: DUF2817 domain-containing protein [Candidatus Gastranaerophilales bacterium]|nr:DUF2817 domain-containing protein [Candidatus Gastranaerophilales bacterium]
MREEYKLLERIKTAQGNTIVLSGLSSRKKQTLVIGVVHGDEPQGGEIINRYLEEYLKSNALFIPVLNPDGKDAGIRTNSNGVDINRNFPTKNWELSKKDNYFGGYISASEIETNFLINVIDKYEPSAILTLHTPYRIVNYDGPAAELAECISDITGYPAEKSIGYPTPGSFGTYAGVERNIPTVTLEMDEEESIDNLYAVMKQVFNCL